MNPHGWETFGDFAGDAGLGLLMFAALAALITLCVWLARR